MSEKKIENERLSPSVIDSRYRREFLIVSLVYTRSVEEGEGLYCQSKKYRHSSDAAQNERKQLTSNGDGK